MSLENKDLNEVGKIANTFGKKGAVKLLINQNYLFNNESTLDGQLLFYLDEKKIIQPLVIKSLRHAEYNLLIIEFDQINDLNQAEKLKNKVIFALKTNNLFVEKVLYEQFMVSWNHELLTVLEVMENPNNVLVKVKINSKPVWIPLVEEYVDKIDFEQKQIFAKNLERLV